MTSLPTSSGSTSLESMDRAAGRKSGAPNARAGAISRLYSGNNQLIENN